MGSISFAGALVKIADGAAKAAPALDTYANAQARVTETTNASADAAENLKEKLDDLAVVEKKVADAAPALADAFGRIAGGLTQVSLDSKNAALGLEGVDWAIRRATPATISLTDAQKALVEQLAKISDTNGPTSLWVGHLIAQLEAGEIGLDDFTSKVNDLLNGLKRLGPVSGDTAGELNALNTALSAFKENTSGGWVGHP